MLVAEVTDEAGNRAVSRMRTPHAYTLTALTALEVVRRILAGDVHPGFQTPAKAYGPDLVMEIGGVKREDSVGGAKTAASALAFKAQLAKRCQYSKRPAVVGAADERHAVVGVADPAGLVHHEHGADKHGEEGCVNGLYAVQLGDVRARVAQNREGGGVSVEVLRNRRWPVRRHHEDFCVRCPELLILMAQLRHMVAAVQSYEAKVEQQQGIVLFQHIREADKGPFVIRERKIRRDIAHS